MLTPPADAITGLAYDLSDPQFRSDPAEYYRWLRDEEPVHSHKASGAILLSRYEDVLACTLDWESFSSASPVAKLRHMASMDPPDHDRLRSSVAQWFSPSAVASLEPMIRAQCRERLEPLRSDTGFDFVRSFASRFPSDVIHQILGIPEELDEPLREAALAVGAALDSEDLQQAMARLEAITSSLYQQLIPGEGPGLLPSLIREAGPNRLEEAEIRGICSNLVLAGTDTVTNLLGNGIVLLAEHPAARRRLVEDPGRIPHAIEEMLRFASPVQSLARRTTRDQRLHGVAIPKGAEIRLMWGAANRDDRVFGDPDSFEIDRDNSGQTRHLALGHGIHFCLGAALARLEAGVAFEELLRIWPDYQIDTSSLERLPSLWVRAWKEIPLGIGS